MDKLKSKNSYARPLVLLAAIIVAVAAALIIGRLSRPKVSYGVREACSILTSNVARQVGGNSLALHALAPVATDTTTTTYCIYRGVNSSVSLVVRSPKDQAGITLNHEAFSPLPVGSQVVRGYGDAAYWSPSFAQLNILEHNTWYILSNGSNTPTKRTLAQSQQLANQLINRL